MLYLGHSLGGDLTPLQRNSRWILQHPIKSTEHVSGYDFKKWTMFSSYWLQLVFVLYQIISWYCNKINFKDKDDETIITLHFLSQTFTLLEIFSDYFFMNSFSPLLILIPCNNYQFFATLEKKGFSFSLKSFNFQVNFMISAPKVVSLV